ncbi:MAG: hypothetical protein H0T69_13795 [Thermoleophilaceae bacterium]|nr:hypothetical protein [Thermoleophilaceae bacterium]
MSSEVDGRLLEVLGRWQGQRVAVRLVVDTELIAVFVGTLGPLSLEKHPELFWPVEAGAPESGGLERPGIYVHSKLLTDVQLHVGDFIFEYRQAGVTVNLRPLEPERDR